MKRIYLTFVITAFLLGIFGCNVKKQQYLMKLGIESARLKVAVLSFAEHLSTRGSSEIVTTAIYLKLKSKSQFDVQDRTETDTKLKAAGFKEFQEVSADIAKKLKKVLDVDAVCTGTTTLFSSRSEYDEAGAQQIEIWSIGAQIKLVSTADGALLYSTENEMRSIASLPPFDRDTVLNDVVYTLLKPLITPPVRPKPDKK